MFTTTRYSAIAFAIFSPIFLLGCSTQKPATIAASTPVPAAPPQAFSLNTPVDRIAANPQGKAILDRDLPGLMASKDYVMFDDMSLSQIATISGGRLTQKKLDLVQADLTQLSGTAP
jgi:hypothetical protein